MLSVHGGVLSARVALGTWVAGERVQLSFDRPVRLTNLWGADLEAEHPTEPTRACGAQKRRRARHLRRHASYGSLLLRRQQTARQLRSLRMSTRTLAGGACSLAAGMPLIYSCFLGGSKRSLHVNVHARRRRVQHRQRMLPAQRFASARGAINAHATGGVCGTATGMLRSDSGCSSSSRS